MPQTLIWFRLYCGFLTLIYVLCIVGGIALIMVPDETMEFPQGFSLVYGIVLAAMGVIFAIAFGIGAFIPKKPWAWVYGMVLICIGMTSALFLPACIPMLIFWLKDHVKEWFGRKLP